jgi:uncharacterized DUF497 family protein
MIEVEWDSHNMRHILDDYPERGNSIIEIESIFSDPFLIIELGATKGEEHRFTAIGLGNKARIIVVIYTISDEKIRPISCWPANRQTKRLYYESIER